MKFGLACTILLAVLLLDILLPLNLNVDPLFILCLFIVMKEQKKTVIFFTLLILSAFILVFCIDVIHYKEYAEYISKLISFCVIITGALLVIRYNRLQAAHQKADQHRITSLENIVFITSHKIRLPVTNILGLSDLLDETSNTAADNVHIINGLKESATVLDIFTRELAEYLHSLKSDTKGQNAI